jgi:hypothetical protein
MVVTLEDLKIDIGKVSGVEQWRIPQQLCDILAFIGFSNFYWRFIKSFFWIVCPLTALTKKAIPFVWLTTYERSFKRLKKSFISAPILYQFDPESKIVVETDASHLIVTQVLWQYDDNNDIIHPVADFSKKHYLVENNYEIYDNESLTIVWSSNAWYLLLEGSSHTIKVISNHQHLTYFTTNR